MLVTVLIVISDGDGQSIIFYCVVCGGELSQTDEIFASACQGGKLIFSCSSSDSLKYSEVHFENHTNHTNCLVCDQFV